MKYNRLLSSSLLLSFACVLSIGECGGCCDDCNYLFCSDGEMKDCANATTAVTCLHGSWIKIDCADSGMVCEADSRQCCDPETGECLARMTQLCEGDIQTAGAVGDSCDPECYKETCIEGGKSALVCENGAVAKHQCSSMC